MIDLIIDARMDNQLPDSANITGLGNGQKCATCGLDDYLEIKCLCMDGIEQVSV